MTTEIPKRPDPAKDTWRTIDLLDHEHSVARVAVEWLRVLNEEDFLQCERPNGSDPHCMCIPCEVREALAKIEASGWRP